jgi:hypothetical protein
VAADRRAGRVRRTVVQQVGLTEVLLTAVRPVGPTAVRPEMLLEVLLEVLGVTPAERVALPVVVPRVALPVEVVPRPALALRPA